MTDHTPLTTKKLTDIEAAIAAYQRHAPTGFACCTAHPVADAGAGLLDEVRRLQGELAEYEVLSPQQCPKGVHADWLIDSEYGHACPWCQIDNLKAGLAAARTAAFTEAETGIATAIDWNRTEYPAVGGMITRRLGMRAAERVVRGLREEAEGGCPGFEGNPVAPDLCAGCHEPREAHATPAAGESGSTR